MENSIKAKKIKSYKRAHHQFLYNLVLYSLTSLITFLFFSYPFWFPSMKDYLLSLSNSILILLNAKYLFFLANIIIFILVGEWKMTRTPRSSLASEVYDEYVARSQIKYDTTNQTKLAKRKEDGVVQKIEEERVEKKLKNKMRISKSMLNLSKINEDDAVQKIKEKRVENKSKNEMRNSKNMLNLSQQMKECKSTTLKKKGLRISKSAVWGENEIVKITRTNKEKKEEQLDLLPNQELNTRVEAFIARVNKKMLLEAESLATTTS